LVNANSAIFQPYHGENKVIFNEMMMKSALYWMFIVLAGRGPQGPIGTKGQPGAAGSNGSPGGKGLSTCTKYTFPVIIQFS
jgi:hypothetical protein